MDKYTYTSIPFIVFFCSTLYAQLDWRSMMHRRDMNFFEIQDSFNNEIGDMPYERGRGIKQYRRWEYYWESRIDEKGNFPLSGKVLQEMDSYYRSHPDSRNYLAGSGNWSALGPINKPINGTGQPNGNGRLNCIAFHPTDVNTIFVGAPSGGFWKSTDNGATWTQYVTGLVRLGVSSIVVHPTNPNIIYIGTGDRDAGDAPGYGVWRSTDGGLTWAAHNTGMGSRTVYEIVMDPTNANVMIASTNGRIYRTTDGGSNWTQVFSGHSCKDIAMHPSNNNILYASGTNFYRSTNNGSSWTQVTSGVPTGSSRMALAVSANQPDYVYILAGDGSGFVALSRSTDSGQNFSQRSNAPNILGYASDGSGNASQAWYDLVLAADPNNGDVIYSAGINIWKSTDGGQTWAISAHWTGSGGADDVHADHHALDFSPHNNHLYNGNDGGLYITTDGGVVWNEYSSGLGIAQIYKIGVAQTMDNTVINGYQDNGTAIYNEGTFITEIGGDGMECIIDYGDESYMYGALYYGNIRRSTNGGANFSTIADNGVNGINESGGWVTPYTLDPNNAARMYIGYKNVWRSDDVKSPAANAITWTRISNLGGSGNMIDIAVAPSDSDVLYVSKSLSGSRLFKTSNATAVSPTFSSLQAGLPINSNVKDIAIDPLDSDHLFIALGNNIYESSNGGTSWTDISGSLPNISLNTIVIDQDSPIEAKYVGMDVGVYYRDNTMSDWLLYSTGLPNVEITELEIHYNQAECKSSLFAASYGQGLWKTDLKDPGNVAAVACFEASSTDICMGEVITLSDNSSYTPTSWAWTITPGTFSFVGGTNANSQNPQVQFLAAGSYDIQLQAANSTGSDVVTKNTYIAVASSTIASVFNEDFEGEVLCGTNNDCGVTTCPLTTSLWVNLTNGVEDDIDFRVNEGGTPSGNTGPSVDFNPGTVTGNYAYTEASGGCTGQTAILESACIQLNQNYSFVFAYHLFGSTTGSLHLDLKVGGAWIEDFVTPIVGDQGNAWQTRIVSLTAYAGQTIKLRIRGVTGSGFESDMAIDDLRFEAEPTLNTYMTDVNSVCDGNGQNLLNWTMSDGLFKGEFSVEKRINDNWSSIGYILADANQRYYEFADNQPFFGENLYRIKMMPEDGIPHYSSITASSCSIDVYTFKVFPNPFKDEVSVQFYAEMEGRLPYRITNLLGQNLKVGNLEASKGLNTFKLPIIDLPKGVYLLHVEGSMFKLVKN